MNYLPLSQVCKINMGQSPESSSYNENGDGLPFFQGNADFGERHPVTRVWCNAPTKIAHAGDILISVRAPIGAMNYASEECCIGRGLAAITPDANEVSSEFIFWLLKGKNTELNSKGTGSTFKAIGRRVLEEVLVPDIGLKQQAEYAQLLETVYNLIEGRKEQLRTLDRLIKARFVELFGEETEHGVPLKECCIDVRGGGTPSMQHPEYYGGNVPFIKSGDVRGDMVSSGALWLTEKALEETIAKYVPQGSVLVVNRSAALLREFRAAIAARPVVINQDIKAFIPKHDYTSEYLLWAIKIQTQLLLTKVTTVLTSHIDLKELLELRIANVSIERQKEFSAFISQVDKSKVVDLSVFTNRAKSYII